MDILILSLNFDPETVGIGRYSGEMAFWLAERGHRITVITAPPYYPQWQIQAPYHNWFQREYRRGVEIRRAPIWVPAQPTAIRRLLHLASFGLSAFVMLAGQLKRPPERLIVVAPAFFCALPGLLFARICQWRGKRVLSVLHIQDFELDAAFALGLLRNQTTRLLATSVERNILHRFDAVATISAAMARVLRAKGVEPTAIRLFPNWVNCSDYTDNKEDSEQADAEALALRGELGIPPDAVVALYSGSMNRKQGIEILAVAAQHLENDPRIWWLFCGDGPSRCDLEKACMNFHRVLFLPLQNEQRFRVLMRLADLHLLPQQAGAADLVMPSKLLAMLASGRPVVATANASTGLARILTGAPASGLITPPGDGKRLGEAIQHLAHNRTERSRMGEAARRQARRRWDRERVLRRFERDLLELKPRLSSPQ